MTEGESGVYDVFGEDWSVRVIGNDFAAASGESIARRIARTNSAEYSPCNVVDEGVRPSEETVPSTDSSPSSPSTSGTENCGGSDCGPGDDASAQSIFDEVGYYVCSSSNATAQTSGGGGPVNLLAVLRGACEDDGGGNVDLTGLGFIYAYDPADAIPGKDVEILKRCETSGDTVLGGEPGQAAWAVVGIQDPTVTQALVDGGGTTVC